MKAKEWVKLLSDLTPGSDEYDKAVNDLYVECNQILALRIKGMENRPTWLKPDLSRWTNAFREAGVKWDAVVHGVAMIAKERNGENAVAPFPLFKGMVLWTKLSHVVQDTAASSRDKSEVFDVLKKIATDLGYQDIPVFKVLLDLGQRMSINANLDEYLQITRELVSYREKASTGNLSMAEANRVLALRMSWSYLSGVLNMK